MRVLILMAALALAGCGQSEPAPRLDQSSADWTCYSGGGHDVLPSVLDRAISIEWRDGVTIIEAEGLMFEQSARFYFWSHGYCMQLMPSPEPPASRG